MKKTFFIICAVLIMLSLNTLPGFAAREGIQHRSGGYHGSGHYRGPGHYRGGDTITDRDTLMAEVSGSDRDGWIHGGGIPTIPIRIIHIRIIPTMQRRQSPPNSNPRYMLSLLHSKMNRITGITARSPRVTIPMSKGVLRAG